LFAGAMIMARFTGASSVRGEGARGWKMDDRKRRKEMPRVGV
jgi:hypothetical protein